MKITVYLNEARGASFDGLTPSKAELIDAGTYDLPASDYIPVEGGRANQELFAQDILNRIYEQLNVGGDLIPAAPYTEAYRAAGHRSLSVGDLVTLTDDRSVLGFQGTYAVERFGFKDVIGARIVIRRGLARYADNQGVLA